MFYILYTIYDKYYYGPICSTTVGNDEHHFRSEAVHLHVFDFILYTPIALIYKSSGRIQYNNRYYYVIQFLFLNNIFQMLSQYILAAGLWCDQQC